jgi:transmembrane 9 superfamily protein 2/4
MSFVNGYFAARTFKMFKGTSWALLALVSSILYPIFIFTVLVVICLCNSSEVAQGYVPFHTAMIMLMIHCGISMPLSWAGSFYGFQKESWKLPGKINMLERKLPSHTPWHQRYIFMIVLGGILPFGGIVF